MIGKAIDRPEPLENDVTMEFSNQLIKPFKTKEGAILDALSAIALINRYCNSLPTDRFTKNLVIWSKKQSNNIVKLKLPMQSTVKDTFTVSSSMILDLSSFRVVCYVNSMQKTSTETAIVQKA